MDTKLKSKHRLGIFLTWLLIIGAAAGMVSAYPYIWQRAVYWKEQRRDIEMEFAGTVCRIRYVDGRDSGGAGQEAFAVPGICTGAGNAFRE